MIDARVVAEKIQELLPGNFDLSTNHVLSSGNNRTTVITTLSMSIIDGVFFLPFQW